MSTVDDSAYLRIGELSRRTGVAPELLRAWERRYGLLRPARSSGGFRLYSDADERRIQLMRAHLRSGLAAAEAARRAVDEAIASADGAGEPGSAELDETARHLHAALDSFDESASQAALDRLFAAFTVETALRDVVVPYLADLGERWASGEASVAQEHFASNLLRGRLLGLARGWDSGEGPRALLACAPGELHDLGLIAFGLALRRRGWRITFLGPDTPIDTLADAAKRLDPALIVVSATARKRLTPVVETLRGIDRTARVAIAGAGATASLAEEAQVELLDADPVTAAASVV
jgi:MerR family transcriptional regulator, light-induced transcriptional regulator